MVLIHVKKNNQSLFLYQTTVSNKVSDILGSIVNIANGTRQISKITEEAEQLLPDERVEQDLKSLQLNEGDAPPATLEITTSDAELLKRAISEARSTISIKQVEAGIPLKIETIKETLNALEGALSLISTGSGPAILCVKSLDATYFNASKEVLTVETTTLWFASKQLSGEKLLSDYVGKNDKTKVVIKIQPRDGGPPMRESALTEEQQKELMLHAFRRQQELKVNKLKSLLN